MEIFSPPRLAPEFMKRPGDHLAQFSIDVLTGYDLSARDIQNYMLEMLQRRKPRAVMLSPPCTMFSKLQNLNRKKSDPTAWAHKVRFLGLCAGVGVHATPGAQKGPSRGQEGEPKGPRRSHQGGKAGARKGTRKGPTRGLGGPVCVQYLIDCTSPANLRLPIADCRFRIVDCGLGIGDWGLGIAECGLQIADCGLRCGSHFGGS